MSPFIKDGDLITVSPLSDASPYGGHVVAFISPATGKVVVHRVVGVGCEHFLIKADRYPDSDELVAEANILGLVTKVERNGKEVFLGLGPEGHLISFLTRNRLLFHLLYALWRLVRPLIKRFAS
jgi:hypothetical protein